ncbi:UPF0691 protein C9orf116 homolog [Stegodyphus dumicola]|uniref:UPF0691 protein C9orf116 homolog n=1 Tax=Stegodyphus dumicola TaxID=202533 RepID=UPI0015B0D302|nr:UPF0691 protein C9orf116 homolog [Stegodyphus dumicola]
MAVVRMDNCPRMETMQTETYDRERECDLRNFDNSNLRTSDVYRTENLPFRFDYPSKWNYGNCVFTPSEGVIKKYIQKPFGQSYKCSQAESRMSHPLFRTTNSEYGSKPPCVHTMPHTFYPRNHKYWENLASVGMYRNRGFNTAVDKSTI